VCSRQIKKYCNLEKLLTGGRFDMIGLCARLVSGARSERFYGDF